MHNQPTLTSTIAITLSFLIVSAGVQARPLFDSHETLDVSVEAPLSTLVKVRSDVDYLEGTFGYTDEVGQTHFFDLKLRARGRYRRQRSTCPFPPVRLNFKTSQLEGSLFEGQDKLKLITHCNNRRQQSEQLVLREYLAYRILQILTDKSFRARLLRVTYIDTEGKSSPMIKYGFVIEDDDEVADRLNLQSLKQESLQYSELDARQTNLIDLYQYLIGNTDFSLIRGPEDDDCCHNSVPFSDGVTTYPVPYDFDFSGLVNAPYASPNPRFKISKVTSRLYRGRCSNNELLPQTIDYMQSKQTEIRRLIDELTPLNDRNRKQVTRYIDSFYRDITDPKRIDRKLLKGCS